MTITQSILSGVVQGITEFFPISSSGHLVILQGLFGLKEPQLAFDIFLHLGTTVSILIFFYKDIIGLLKNRRLAVLLITGSIPTFIIGMSFKDIFERFFAMPKVVGYMLVVTGVWLIVSTVYSSRFNKSGTKKELGFLNSIIVGIAQGISIMPGISRSGATIATGMLTGLEREVAFKFSFLLAVPAVLGAVTLKAHKIGFSLITKDAFGFIVGGLVAMIVGIFSIKALLKIVRNNQLYIFGVYCLIAGTLVAILF